LPDAERCIRERKSLIKPGGLTELSDLKNFFLFASARFDIPDSFAHPIDLETLRNGFLRDFIEPIKSIAE
jgi:hypothetical protein